MYTKTIVATALAVVAASAQEMNSTMNLTSLIASNSNLTGLAQVLQGYPGVASQIANMTNVTLFAPNNNAVQALMSSGAFPNATGTNLTDDITELLSYHIVNGKVYASNITSTPAFASTALNNTKYDNVTGGQRVEVRLVGNTTVEVISGLRMVANVTQANLNFTGGVVHVIDSVLTVPLNVSSTAAAADLTAFLGATEATNLTTTLDEAKDITIFAPSNSAFQAIGSANLSATELASILEYHVVNGTVAYSSSLTNTSAMTLGGKKLNVTVEDGAVFINSARVVVPDVLIAGGVLHIIDSVLNPNATNATTPNASETSAVVAFSGVSSASTVPFTSGIPTASTTIAALMSTQTAVATGYSSVMPAGGAGAASSAAGAKSSSSSAAAAAMAAPTGAIGAAALFGGAALFAARL